MLVSVRRTVAEYLHRTYQQTLPSSLLNEPVFELGFNVSPDLGGNSSTVLASTGYSEREHVDVGRAPTTKTLVASSSSLAECTMSLREGLIGLVSSVPLASSSSSGPNTVDITSSHPEVSSLQVAFSSKVSSVLASGISLATSSAVLPQAASPSDSVKPIF